MNKTRLEAFSDGVLAIIITIMVLELKMPHEVSLQALASLWPVFSSYLISFIYVGIYWGNHHHLLHTVHHVNSKIIWANMGLLFCLSLLPFTTSWMGAHFLTPLPICVYAINLAICAIAFYFLQQAITTHYKFSAQLTEAFRKQKTKGYTSLMLYIIAALSASFIPLLSLTCIIIPPILWVIPDKNIEAALEAEREK